MKICIISYLYPTKENKTLGLFVHHQARELAKNNEVHIITKRYGNMPDYELVDGVKVHRINRFNLALQNKIASLHGKIKFEIIHSHFLGFSTLLCGIASRMLRLPFVVTLHGSEIMSASAIKKIYLSFADRIMCVSKYTAHLAENITDKGKITIISNGVDTERLKAKRKADLFKKQIGLANNHILLSVADLVKRKGIDTVIKALPSVKNNHPDLAYIIIGKGPEKDNLISLAKKLKIDKNIRLVGYVSDEGLSNYYNACDVFELMSRTLQKENAVEGFGIVFIEASLFKKPVIAGKSGGTSDAVINGVTGFLVDPDDKNELQEKINMLLKNPELRKRLGINGKNFVMKNMLWKHNARKTIDVYKDAMRIRHQ